MSEGSYAVSMLTMLESVEWISKGAKCLANGERFLLSNICEV